MNPATDQMAMTPPPEPGMAPMNWLSDLQQRHQSWYLWSLVYFALAALFLLAGAIDERTFQGVSVWNKPFKFSLSFVAYFATLGWFAPLLGEGYFATRRGRLLTNIAIVCAALELLYIVLQAARGEPSHFNVATPLYSTMYSLMGLGAVLLVACCAWMGMRILRCHGWANPWTLAVGIGLIGTFVLGGGFGGYLGNAGSHWVSANPTDANGLWLVHWARDGGDLRVAHFFGMHAMQIIPLAGAAILWLHNRTRLNASGACALVIAFTTAFAAFTTSTFLQALRGIPLIAG